MSRKLIRFTDYPEFTPNVTPQEMFELGVFGGTYFRPIYSSVVGKHLKDQHKEFDYLKAMPAEKVTSSTCDKSINYFKAKAGSSLADWEAKNWMRAQDPYGWVQWYCRFYEGRRSPDDRRQIDRWLRYSGKNGRWRRRHENEAREKGKANSSKVVRQGLLQWAWMT